MNLSWENPDMPRRCFETRKVKKVHMNDPQGTSCPDSELDEV